MPKAKPHSLSPPPPPSPHPPRLSSPPPEPRSPPPKVSPLHAGWPSAAGPLQRRRRSTARALLFFAYGGKQLQHFLAEATVAAASFRRLNPTIPISIVTNAESGTLDNRTFDTHIRPRPDLLFAGSTTNGDWADNATVAHSPLLLGAQPVPNHLGARLKRLRVHARLGTRVSPRRDRVQSVGLDIATANQRDGPLYPHNFNLVYKWSPRVSALMRDWLLLQMRAAASRPTIRRRCTLQSCARRRRAAWQLGRWRRHSRPPSTMRSACSQRARPTTCASRARAARQGAPRAHEESVRL